MHTNPESINPDQAIHVLPINVVYLPRHTSARIPAMGSINNAKHPTIQTGMVSVGFSSFRKYSVSWVLRNLIEPKDAAAVVCVFVSCSYAVERSTKKEDPTLH